MALRAWRCHPEICAHVHVPPPLPFPALPALLRPPQKLAELRKGVTDLIAPVNDIKKKRDCSHVNHAMAVAEAAPGFAWVCMDMGPCDWITSAKDAAEFYLNKVRKQAKDEGGKQAWTDFANAVRDSLTGLHDFVKEHFKPGLSWNPKGYDVDAYLAAVGGGAAAATGGAGAASSPAAAAPAATAGSGAAAAPSGGAAAASSSSSTPKADSASLQSALFAQLGSIDQSSGRTAGLKHVTKDMKSSALKETTPAPVAKTPSAAAGTAAAGAASGGSKFNAVPTGTARCELVDKRWYVEFQQTKGTQLRVPPAGSDKELTIAHEVYIYGCKDVAVFIDRKCKGVRVDKCVNVTIMMEAVLSGVEVVDCKKLKLQANQALPSIAIDKTDGVLVGLAWPARDCQIVTSKSSEMNVTFPNKEGDDADWLEQPIPEQFVSKLTAANKLTTTVSELYTA